MKNSKHLLKWALVISTAFSLAACSDEPSKEPTPTPTVQSKKEVPAREETASVPKYKIIELEDISVAKTIRFTCYVVIEDAANITEQGIEAIAKDVVQKQKQNGDLNALTMFMVDDEREVGQGYNIARVIYAPNGKIEDAVSVTTGDYSSHKFTYDIKKLPKDNPDGPTEEELKVYYDVMEILQSDKNPSRAEKYDPEAVEKYEQEAVETVAKKYNLTVEEVDKIFIKAALR